MRNAVFPPYFPQICSFGTNEVQNLQMPNSDFSLHLDNTPNVYGNFCNDVQTSNDHHLSGRFAPLPVPAMEIPIQNYLPGFLTMNSTYEDDSQQPILPDKRFAVSKSQVGFQTIENTKKRQIKFDNPIDNEISTKELKKQKAICIEEQPNYRVPVRRSQKIGDRITALQKLVSPFGKTDTASVLQEASVYIKLLQEQIQMLSTPYFRVRPLHLQGTFGEEEADLRSRGLCLVPVSFTQKLTKEARVDHATSRRSIIP